MQQQTFYDWFAVVDREVQSILMVSVHDIPDMPYRMWYEKDISPSDAAQSVVEETLAEFGFDPEGIFDGELSRTQLDQQDKVDNAIHRLLTELIDGMSWDIEAISTVRDVVLPIVARRTGKTEADLYPALKCKKRANFAL